MSRLRADLLLLLAALIWGVAFVAQKFSFAYIGPFTFIAARFFISALLVLPLAVREHRRQSVILFGPSQILELVLLCVTFSAAVIVQQMGIAETSVTNAGFLTGLYVVFVPVIGSVVYRQRLSVFIVPAAALSILGDWLLSDETIQRHIEMNRGDLLVVLCAVGFAWQITLIGRIMRRSPAPFRLSCLQYAAVATISLVTTVLTEHPALKSILAAAGPILYAGILSGGVAYTLQMIAQQHTPPADSAVILSAEAVFAALAGAVLTGDRLTLSGWAGCSLIFTAILLVEFGPCVLKALLSRSEKK
ncbi:MAG: DMT family transporter [Proteobacteria bacterium]|nr:DMT family transporter [Pseudomonadota bacterium]